MIKKLSKYGNSLAILIDKPILQLLNIDEETQLQISTDGNNIIIKPMRKEAQKKLGKISEDKKTQASYERVMKKHRKAFKELAEK